MDLAMSQTSLGFDTRNQDAILSRMTRGQVAYLAYCAAWGHDGIKDKPPLPYERLDEKRRAAWEKATADVHTEPGCGHSRLVVSLYYTYSHATMPPGARIPYLDQIAERAQTSWEHAALALTKWIARYEKPNA